MVLMGKRARRAGLAVTTGIALMASSGLALAAPHGRGHGQGHRISILSFIDLGNVGWARPAINQMVQQCVLRGVQSDLFAPLATTTRADMAVLLGRVLGWGGAGGAGAQGGAGGNDRRAVRRPRRFGDMSSIPSWALQDVQFAASAGILVGNQNDDFMPEGAVTWAQAAVIMERVFQFPPVAPDQIAGELAQIPGGPATPAWAAPDVAAEIAAGVFSGTEGQNYSANAPLPRADLAVLLQNAEVAAARPIGPSAQLTVGSVLAVGATSITLQSGCGATSVPVGAGVPVYTNGSATSLSAVAAGETVMVGLNNGQATFIDVLTPAQTTPPPPSQQQVSGTVTAAPTTQISILESNGQTTTYDLAPQVAVTGLASSLSGVAANEQVTLSVNQSGEVDAIDVTSAATQTSQVSGTVAAAPVTTSITLSGNNVPNTTFVLQPSGVAVSGQVDALGAIAVGDQVTLTLNLQTGQATAIDVTSVPTQTQVTGTVASAPANGAIGVTTSSGTTTYALGSGATVTGLVASLADIIAGDQVTMTLNASQQVTAIDVTSVPNVTSQVSGTVSAGPGNGSITLAGSSSPYTLASSVTVTGQVTSLPAVAPGDQVTLTLNGAMQVTAIDVTAVPTPESQVSGTIVSAGTAGVQIAVPNSTTFDFQLAANVTYSGLVTSLQQVVAGDQATLTIDSGGQVTAIDVTAPPAGTTTVQGTLVNADASSGQVALATYAAGSGTFTITVYTLIAGAPVTLGGNQSGLSHLQVGDSVTVGVDGAGQPVSLAAVPIPSGQPSGTGVLDANSAGQIGLYTSGGQQIDIPDGATPLAAEQSGSGWSVVALSGLSFGQTVAAAGGAINGSLIVVVQ